MRPKRRVRRAPAALAIDARSRLCQCLCYWPAKVLGLASALPFCLIALTSIIIGAIVEIADAIFEAYGDVYFESNF